MKNSILVSWLMCVHEENEFLYQAIDSCLDQTFVDFELIIVVNGFQVDLLYDKIVSRYELNKLVRVFKSEFKYLNQNLNFGVQNAYGEYIARMDSDDVAFHNRLEIQVNYLKENADVGLIASGFEYFSVVNGQSIINQSNIGFMSTSAVKNSLYYRNPICHPSVMFRKRILLELGGYLGGIHSEDYDLWVRIATESSWEIHILETKLIRYNMVHAGAARQSREAYANMAGTQLRSFLLTGNFKWLLGSIISIGKALILGK